MLKSKWFLFSYTRCSWGDCDWPIDSHVTTWRSLNGSRVFPPTNRKAGPRSRFESSIFHRRCYQSKLIKAAEFTRWGWARVRWRRTAARKLATLRGRRPFQPKVMCSRPHSASTVGVAGLSIRQNRNCCVYFHLFSQLYQLISLVIHVLCVSISRSLCTHPFGISIGCYLSICVVSASFTVLFVNGPKTHFNCKTFHWFE